MPESYQFSIIVQITGTNNLIHFHPLSTYKNTSSTLIHFRRNFIQVHLVTQLRCVWLGITRNSIDSPKMCRTTIRQRWSVIVLSWTGMRAPAISRRIGIPQERYNGIFSWHTVRPDEVKDLPRSGRPHKTTPWGDRRLGRLTIRNHICTSIGLRRR